MKRRILSSFLNDIQARNIQFFSKILPPLGEGDYKIISEHYIARGFDNTQKKRFQKTQQFSVQGPRFQIDSAD